MAETDPFDRWLQQELQNQEPYLVDNGFTDALLAKLPEKPLLAKSPKTDNRLVYAATVIGSAIVANLFPVEATVSALLSTSVQMSQLVMIGAVASAIATAVAVQKARDI